MNALIDLLNRWGSSFTDFAQPMLVQSITLILLVALFDYGLRNRVRAILRHGIWMLVLIKMVLPTSLSSPTGLVYWLPHSKNHAKISDDNLRIQILQSQPNGDKWNANKAETVSSSTNEITSAPLLSKIIPSPSVRRPSLHISAMLFLAWTAGVVGLSILVCYRMFQMSRIIRLSSYAPGNLERLLPSCGNELKLTRLPQLRVCAESISPALCGIFRPVILLPRNFFNGFDEKMLRSILLHELAHYQRRDLWVNGLQTVLQIFYFYNPFLWFANTRIRKVREQAVDETVLVALKNDAVVYPQTLLTMARLAFAQPRSSFCLVGIMEPRSALGQRIKRMLETPLPNHSRFGWIGLCLVLALGAIMLPMSRAQKKEGSPKSASKVELTPELRAEFQKLVDDYSFTIYGENQFRIVQRLKDNGLLAVNFLRDILQIKNDDGNRKEAEQRRKAAYLLYALGPVAKPAIPELTKALEDEQTVAIYAAMALANFGPEANLAVGPLIESLHAGNGQAALALVAIAPGSPDVLAAFIEVLQEKNRPEDLGQLRSLTAKAVGNFGPDASAAIPILREALEERNELLKMFAANSLRRIAPDSPEALAEVEKALKVNIPTREDLPMLLKKIKSTDSNQKLDALSGLSMLGSEAGAAWPDVAGLLEEEELTIRETALGTLGRLNVEKDKTLELLVKYLRGSDSALRSAAANGLAEMGTNARPVLPDLLKALRDSDNDNKGNILAAFCRPGLQDTNALTDFRQLLKSLNPGIRNNAAAALGYLGSSAKEAIPDLKRLLQDSDFGVRRMSVLALWRIDQIKPPIGLLSEMLSKDDNMEEHYLPIIRAMGPEAADLAPSVKPLLSHWDPKIRVQAKAAWESMFPQGSIPPERTIGTVRTAPAQTTAELKAASSKGKIPPKFAHLIHKLNSSNLDVRLDSAAALAKMGPTASDAVPFLLPMLKDPNPEVRSYVAAILGELDPQGKQVVLPLAQLLKDSDAEIRGNALASLKKIGSAATEAVPALQIALNDENADVRATAREILGRINPTR